MGNEGNVKNNEEMEIDLLQLFEALKKKIWVILAAMIIGGGLAGAYSKFVITPQYSSTAMMYILSKETTLTSLADLQIGSQLTKDYKILVTSRPVLEGVIETLGLDILKAISGGEHSRKMALGDLYTEQWKRVLWNSEEYFYGRISFRF